MSATSSPSPQPGLDASQIDASCRLPLFTIFSGAAFWLVLSSAFGLIASLTFHAPAMFANCPSLSYGRAYPAWGNLLVFGFCIPSGLGVGMWILARLGRVELQNPWLIALGAKLWHIGVFVGLISILIGQTTGYAWLEMPRYAAVILFLAFLMISISVFATYSRRDDRSVFPSQWFVLASLFWFPWIYSTAVLLLEFFPVRGLVQSSVAWWFAGNLLNVWLGLAGLAATFYLLPKLLNKPLQSFYVALFVFWTLVLFGTWTGIPARVPLPAWMPTLSAVGKLLFLMPSLAVASVVLATNAQFASGNDRLLPFVRFGAWCFTIAGILLALVSCPQINMVTAATWFNNGEVALRVYGFFAMTMFAAIYYILPRVAGLEICPNRVRAHFWLSMIGIVVQVAGLLAAGLLQGMKLNDPAVPFAAVVKAMLMPFRLSTVGDALLILGNLIFFINVALVILSFYRAVAKSAYAKATARLKPAEANP